MLMMTMRSGLAVLAVLLGLVVAIGPSLTSAAAPAPAAGFVAVSSGSGLGLQENLSLYSSTTGILTRRLASFGESFTNNGLAVTPDRSEVYFTLIPPHPGRRFSLRLMRIDVATRRQTFIADGEQPAVSDDGNQLAYGAARHGLAVRDLGSGRTRRLGLVTQLGPAADLLDASVTWLADGSDIAIVPSPPAYIVAGPRRAPAVMGSCRFSDTHRVIVFVHVPAAPAPLAADCVHVAEIGPGDIALAGSPASPTSLLLAADQGRRTLIESIAQTGATTRVLTFTDSLPVAIDRSGTHLLYLVGHSPPALWEATIAAGRLTDQRRLIADSELGPAAW
jgi:hypothetical protein